MDSEDTSNSEDNGKKLKLDPSIDPWDQQPGESAKQYSRFLRYRGMGRMRSLPGLQRLLSEIGDELTIGTVRVNSYIFRWSKRAEAWERHQDELDMEKVEKARRDMLDKHLAVGSALLNRGVAALRATNIKDIDPATAVRIIKLGADLETRALGMAQQTFAVTGPTGGPVQTEDLTGLTPQERRIRLREITAELARRAGMATIQADDDPDSDDQDSDDD